MNFRIRHNESEGLGRSLEWKHLMVFRDDWVHSIRRTVVDILYLTKSVLTVYS